MVQLKNLFFCGLRTIAWGLLCLPFLVSCSSTSNNTNQSENHFEMHIKKPYDVKKLNQLETVLTVTPEKAAYHPDYQVVEEISVPYLPEYRIGPGDVVEIVYHIRYDEPLDNYLLEVQDRISIQFPYHPQFSSSVLVRTDGKITVPLIGDVRAEGLSPMALAKKLNQQYKNLLNRPNITIALEEFNAKIAELKKAITTAPRGQSKIAPVTPDGKISFPIIGTLQAEGFTVSQLEKIVNKKYKAHVRNLNATLIMLEIKAPKVYIFGEVASQGAYDMPSRLNLLEALALSGGYLNSADLEQVIVFRNEGLERPIAFKIDLKTALTSGNLHANLWMKPADIVFIPKTGLDSWNDQMAKIWTKGIWTILPFQSSYSWNYRIDGSQP